MAKMFAVSKVNGQLTPLKCDADGALCTGAAVTATGATGVAVSDALTIVLPSTEIIDARNFMVYLTNVGGGSGDALVNVDIEVGPDGLVWQNIDAYRDAFELGADTLAAAATGIAFIAENAAIRYIRVRAQCGAGNDTTVTCWLAGN